MNSKINFGKESRDQIKTGVDTLANAVKVTLGAAGRNVIIQYENQFPQITKDGVTVARSITCENPISNMGSELIKEIAQKTNEQAGDGTTTATILAQAIITEGLKNIASGSNPMYLKKGIDKAVKLVVEYLKIMADPVGDYNNIAKIASISANNDMEIGNLIAEAIKLVSKDGVITIEEAKGVDTTVEVVEGMQFEKGYLSPYFVTDTTKMEVIYDNPYILLCSKRITSIQELLPIMEKIVRAKKPLILIVDELDAEALQMLIINKIKGTLQVCAVKSPNYGQIRKDYMDDIAIMTGGKVINPELGMTLDNIDFDDLGEAKKVIINQNSTTIIGGLGDKEKLKERIDIIKYQADNCKSSFDEEQLRERISKLSGGIGVIYVGGSSEIDIRERKDRFEDAINATRAAVAEGIIPGGGLALLHCSMYLTKKAIKRLNCKNEDEILGVKLIGKIIEEPFKQIIMNAGDNPEVVLSEINKHKKFTDYGYNVDTERYERFLETGVIDPVKVSRVALENAASIAGLLLTTECVIFNKKEDIK